MKAMLAEDWDSRVPIHTYIHDERYVFEQKLDGHRIMLLIHNGTIVDVVNRSGERSQHYCRFTSDDRSFKQFASRSFILDGELVDGVFYAFDLPELEGMIDNSTPHNVRKTTLDKMFEIGNFNDNFKVVETAKNNPAKTALMVNCNHKGAEGVMVKDTNAPYVQGRSKHMLKVKFTKSGDFVVRKMNIDGKINASLGVYNKYGDLVEVGRCSLIGKEDVQTGDVVEVRYLYVSDAGRLVQPRMKFKREDKDPRDCLINQLKQSNTKTVVAL